MVSNVDPHLTAVTSIKFDECFNINQPIDHRNLQIPYPRRNRTLYNVPISNNRMRCIAGVFAIRGLSLHNLLVSLSARTSYNISAEITHTHRRYINASALLYNRREYVCVVLAQYYIQTWQFQYANEMPHTISDVS